jgi:hypothetical protein
MLIDCHAITSRDTPLFLAMSQDDVSQRSRSCICSAQTWKHIISQHLCAGRYREIRIKINYVLANNILTMSFLPCEPQNTVKVMFSKLSMISFARLCWNLRIIVVVKTNLPLIISLRMYNYCTWYTWPLGTTFQLRRTKTLGVWKGHQNKV